MVTSIDCVIWFDPWVGKIPRRREWLSTLVFLPGEFHGQRSLVGCSSWGGRVGHKGACWAAIYVVAQSRTRLKRRSSSSRATNNFTFFQSTQDTLCLLYVHGSSLLDPSSWSVGCLLLTCLVIHHSTQHTCSVCKSCLTLLQPHGLEPTRLLCPWDFPDKNTRVCCHSLLQEMFPTTPTSPAFTGGFFTTEPPGKPCSAHSSHLRSVC